MKINKKNKIYDNIICKTLKCTFFKNIYKEKLYNAIVAYGRKRYGRVLQIEEDEWPRTKERSFAEAYGDNVPWTKAFCIIKLSASEYENKQIDP